MKEHMTYSANDKMVNHKIFWDNVWNWISLGMITGGAIALFQLFKEFSIWFS